MIIWKIYKKRNDYYKYIIIRNNLYIHKRHPRIIELAVLLFRTTELSLLPKPTQFRRFAFDLYRNTIRDVSLSFTNPYHKTTAVSYNHKTKVCVTQILRYLSQFSPYVFLFGSFFVTGTLYVE